MNTKPLTRKGNFKKLQINPGDKFGRLTVIREGDRCVQPSGQTNRVMICSCECGREVSVRVAHLTRGRVKSCKCSYGEPHGMSGTTLYRVWHGMKNRCFDPNHINAERYSGRGIGMDPAWKKSFTAFANWAMANGYQEGLQIDRINNNGNYEPQNCRFVPNIVNVNNREITFMINYNGLRVPFKDLLREKKIPETHEGAIRGRIRRGWNHQKAIDTPIRTGNYKRRAA